MKIRKANVLDERKTTNVYIYENKKEEYIVIAVPDLEWSYTVCYEEETEALRTKLLTSLRKIITEEQATPFVDKLLYWVREM
ncbi:YueH family protein [Anoxybacteroides amylolyticum]|uniref:YueH-like family protein n=1 Tax=Anoxybacteroides amylolyticum TaxID=294699 RepID=A0A167TFK6_9BACL|nr:YueH family protein [Anoxybacillus amylolyticus]ANB60494.1 yueH-like family protein [Anoxybacillus amylolyticus]